MRAYLRGGANSNIYCIATCEPLCEDYDGDNVCPKI